MNEKIVGISIYVVGQFFHVMKRLQLISKKFCVPDTPYIATCGSASVDSKQKPLSLVLSQATVKTFIKKKWFETTKSEGNPTHIPN